MQSFREKEIRLIGRRDFLKTGMTVGLSIVIPGVMSCKGKEVPGVGNSLSEVALNDLRGNKVMIPANCRGKVALLHFWAGWCPTCRTEMLNLEAISHEYGGQGVIPCSIGINENRETAMSYIRNINITYPILLDPHATTQKRFGISGIPTYYFLSREGIITYKVLGTIDKTRLEKMVRAIL
ncbi:MAG: TlpA family protein disulfide reductase [Syntrophales bacterium]|jgi:thiol-disulfide isomerase/thioredoxin|nr:TlpA family protein disulfide reductase [Syntrophales bacterium]